MGRGESRGWVVVPLCSGTSTLCDTEGRCDNQGGGGRCCTEARVRLPAMRIKWYLAAGHM